MTINCYYCACVLDALGNVTGAMSFFAANEVAAELRAAALDDGYGVELWNRERLLKTIPSFELKPAAE